MMPSTEVGTMLFLVPANAPGLVYVLSSLLDDAYKRTLAANWK